MNNTSTAILSKVVKLSAYEYNALTTKKKREAKTGGIAYTTRMLKSGEAFHISNVKAPPTQAYQTALDNGFRVAVRAGLNHIGQAGYWIVRKHG